MILSEIVVLAFELQTICGDINDPGRIGRMGQVGIQTKECIPTLRMIGADEFGVCEEGPVAYPPVASIKKDKRPASRPSAIN
jgi:hypothetical protein